MRLYMWRVRMTDIVERLKKIFLPSDYFKELCEVRNAVAEIERLREENGRIKATFRVNMLRCFPNLSHEEIDAVIMETNDENRN